MNRLHAPDFHGSDPRECYLMPHEIEREEDIALVRWNAEQGRVKSAREYCRRMLIEHLENRPGPDGYAKWRKVSDELWTLRREIPAIAERAERRMPSYEREKRAAFNKFIGEAA